MPVVIDSVNGITQATWTTAGRPGSPVAGQVGFNTSLNALEQYDGSGWETIPQWTTSNRPTTPAAGYSGYNIDTKAFEFYNGTSWIGFNQSNLSTTASYLLVAGGGGGGSRSAGGGGAGGLLTGTVTLTQATSYTVTVGSGGAGAAALSELSGTSGSSSSISGSGITTVTSTGGGGGGGNNAGTDRNGKSGGSGGGASRTGTVGSGTPGQGNNGGLGNDAPNYNGGGGGGSGAVGSAASGSNAGAGGAGTASSIIGTSVTYAGGGGGGAYTGSTIGTGGSGGGGNGGLASGTGGGGAGTTNSGSGGGGGGEASPNNGGSGGSGVAIISYPGSQAFTGGLITSSGGNTIHTFTSSGTLTPISGVLNLTNSLRFRASASAYLNRTPAAASNRKTWTLSMWFKLGALPTADNNLYRSSSDAGANQIWVYFNSSNSNALNFGIRISSVNYQLQIAPIYRDPAAWYHLVYAVDTTQATSSERAKIYINGQQVTNFISSSYPPQNSDTSTNSTGGHALASLVGGGSYFDGYMANVQFIDGQQLTPANFGNTDAYGNWKPVTYTGTYGTNGFYLKFSDATLTSGANTGLGADSSGNGNYWTTNNISVTAGTTYDSMTDVPTNTSATVANYCVLNPLAKRRTVAQVATFSEANLRATFPNAAGNATFAIGTFGVTTGKWYWEISVITRATEIVIGIGNTGTLDEINGGAGYQATNGAISGFTSNPPAGASYTSGDIIGVALDVDAGTCALYKNNVLQGTGTGLLSTPQPWVQGNTNDVINANFGQRPFAYTPPSGFVALNTFNLSTPTILQGNLYMDATLYTGNGTNRSITNTAGFRPDLVWGQARSAAYGSWLYDAVRGATKQIESFGTNAETTQATMVTAFNSNGFNIGTDTAGNQSSITYVAWQWQAGSSTVTNTSGSISSQVRANTTTGFSIVTYTGNGVNSTVGHGLGVAPKMILVKNRTTAGGNGIWRVYHTTLGGTKYINLNETTAAITGSTVWNNTNPTSSVFTVGITGTVNDSANNYVAYCWAEIAGFSAFGSYTGNGSADGPFVYTGFRPKWVLIKNISAVGSWFLFDTARLGYNSTNNYLLSNASTAETTYNGVDILSNGFKLRNTDSGLNDNGVSYIYAAFAENPFKFSNAR